MLRLLILHIQSLKLLQLASDFIDSYKMFCHKQGKLLYINVAFDSRILLQCPVPKGHDRQAGRLRICAGSKWAHHFARTISFLIDDIVMICKANVFLATSAEKGYTVDVCSDFCR